MNRTRPWALRAPTRLVLAALAAAALHGQQAAPDPHAGHQMPAATSPNAAPAQASAVDPATRAMRLDDLEQMALRRSPSLALARAAVRTARALRQQAGLYPNPVVGYDGGEIAGGPTFRGGEQGFFVEQRVLTGGKLGLAKRFADQDIAVAEAGARAEELRVRNAVRVLFYQALGEQRLLQVRRELARLAQRAVQTTSELKNVGQADEPDQLAIEIEAQRLELGLTTAQNALDRTWRQLAAVTGNVDLRPQPLDGDLEALPKLDFDGALARLLGQSPELTIAQAGTARTQIAVQQARVAVTPDLVVRGGAHYNFELLELNRRPVGWQYHAEVGVSLPLFNRNQGLIQAARAEAERATLAVERTRLSLRARLAATFREYQDAVAAVERYRTQMIPRARRAYELYQTSFRAMAAAYPQVVITQRNLFQVQEDYVATLVSAWQRAVEIEGLLLTGEIAGMDEGPHGLADVTRTRGAGEAGEQ